MQLSRGCCFHPLDTNRRSRHHKVGVTHPPRLQEGLSCWHICQTTAGSTAIAGERTLPNSSRKNWGLGSTVLMNQASTKSKVVDYTTAFPVNEERTADLSKGSFSRGAPATTRLHSLCNKTETAQGQQTHSWPVSTGSMPAVHYQLVGACRVKLRGQFCRNRVCSPLCAADAVKTTHWKESA